MTDTKKRIVPRWQLDNDCLGYEDADGPWCRDDDVAMLEHAIHQLAKALTRACRHDDPDNSGLCIKCGVTLDFDGPLHLVDEDGVDWPAWSKEQK